MKGFIILLVIVGIVILVIRPEVLRRVSNQNGVPPTTGQRPSNAKDVSRPPQPSSPREITTSHEIWKKYVEMKKEERVKDKEAETAAFKKITGDNAEKAKTFADSAKKSADAARGSVEKAKTAVEQAKTVANQGDQGRIGTWRQRVEATQSAAEQANAAVRKAAGAAELAEVIAKQVDWGRMEELRQKVEMAKDAAEQAGNAARQANNIAENIAKEVVAFTHEKKTELDAAIRELEGTWKLYEGGKLRTDLSLKVDTMAQSYELTMAKGSRNNKVPVSNFRFDFEKKTWSFDADYGDNKVVKYVLNKVDGKTFSGVVEGKVNEWKKIKD